jgi:phage shock protein PspC (stress-responsive transcriptional regulator)
MNDKPNKNTKSTKKKAKPDEPGPRRPLLRSKDERMVFGVAGGLAEHLNIDVTLVRIGLVIAALFGGVGILAYLVLAVALPQNDGTGKPVEESLSSRFGRVFLVVILAAIGICVACVLAVMSAWTAATGHGTAIAAIVIGFGALIAAVAFLGDLRRKAAPWLIGAALLLAVPAGAVAAADIEIDESIGEREYTPTTVADVDEDGYELGTGQLIVDLRNLPWKAGETIPVAADLGLGQMIVSVPPEVCVKAHATAKAGDLVVAGDRSDGWHADVDQGSPTTDAPTLELDASVQFGQIVVTDEDPVEFERHRGPDDDYDQKEMEEAQERVCGR